MNNDIECKFGIHYHYNLFDNHIFQKLKFYGIQHYCNLYSRLILAQNNDSMYDCISHTLELLVTRNILKKKKKIF